MISVCVNSPLTTSSAADLEQSVNALTPTAWLAQVARKLQARLERPGTNLGHLEELLLAEARSFLRPVLEAAAQALARRQAPDCPVCQTRLAVEAHERPRTVDTILGAIELKRDYGWCARCLSWVYAADSVLGLHPRANGSPSLQQLCAAMVLSCPASQARQQMRRLTGLSLSASTLHREALRQGQRALQIRRQDLALLAQHGGAAVLARRAQTPATAFTLVIEMDAWNIRERDNWGKTEELAKENIDPGRWHWVYVGTVFRLDQRGVTAGQRPIISERGYVATREGLAAFEQQLYAECLQRGLLQAQQVLVIADGALWIWNLAQDRFKDARQRVDAYHVKEHLWELAHTLHGRGTPQAHAWVRPLLRHLDDQPDGALDVIQELKSLEQTMLQLTQRQREDLQREIGYFEDHQQRMDYAQAKAAGEPIGSGAIESTCRQYQRRFKCVGQFWSRAGDEALLALETLHRNERWHLLFPHASDA
jgi:hypothetical protein